MKKLFILCGFVGLLGLNSCTDHEVIPPPLPLVDLNCDCEATINDSVVKYQDSCYYESVKNIVTGGVSTARYRTRLEEIDIPGGLELEARTLSWTDDGTNNPTLEEWRSFFTDNTSPNFSDNVGHSGVVVRWTDPNGNIWESDTSVVGAICIQSFTYNILVNEKDVTGDYMQFDATFDCMLKNSDYGVVDSIKCLTGARMRSAFRLE